MRAHCVAMSYGYEAFKRALEATPGLIVGYERKDMMARTRGPHMRVRAVRISRRAEDDENAEAVPVEAS